MQVKNNGTAPILAKINPTNSGDPDDLEWFEVPAGESIEVADYKVASTLVEHGATASAADLAAARELWAERNRNDNSRAASASASEGAILGRQQATVSVAEGTATAGDRGALRGAALDDAVRAANDAGADIRLSASATDKREALAEWQARRGTSTPPEDSGRYVEVDGELYLDDEGQPVELAGVQVDGNGDPVLVDGKPVPRLADTAGE